MGLFAIVAPECCSPLGVAWTSTANRLTCRHTGHPSIPLWISACLMTSELDRDRALMISSCQQKFRLCYSETHGEAKLVVWYIYICKCFIHRLDIRQSQCVDDAFNRERCSTWKLSCSRLHEIKVRARVSKTFHLWRLGRCGFTPVSLLWSSCPSDSLRDYVA